MARHTRPPARTEPRRDHGRARRARVAHGAPVPDDLEPEPGRRPRLGHRRRRRRRGARRHHPQRRPLGRGDDRAGRLCRRPHPRAARARHRRRDRHRPRPWARPRDDQRRHRDPVQGTGDRGDARHAEHLPRRRLPGRRQPPGPAGRPPAGLHRCGPRHISRHPDLRRRRRRRRRDRVGDPALDAVRAAALRGRKQSGGGGHPRHPVSAGRLHGLLDVRPAGGRRRRDVGHGVRDDQRHVGDGRGPGGRRRGRRRRRQHLRWLRHARRRRSRRPVPRLHRERADPRRPVAVLAAGHLRCRDPGRGHARTRSSCAASSGQRSGGAFDDAPLARLVSRAGRLCSSSPSWA